MKKMNLEQMEQVNGGACWSTMATWGGMLGRGLYLSVIAGTLTGGLAIGVGLVAAGVAAGVCLMFDAAL